jgi:hypothetical protein
MKQLKRDLQAVLKNLKLLTQKTEKLSKKLVALEKVSTAKKPSVKPKTAAKVVKKTAVKRVGKKPAAKKVAKKVTASDTVLNVIKRSKKGLNTAALMKKTNYDERKVRSIVFRLRKQGKINSDGKGLYTKAG